MPYQLSYAPHRPCASARPSSDKDLVACLGRSCCPEPDRFHVQTGTLLAQPAPLSSSQSQQSQLTIEWPVLSPAACTLVARRSRMPSCWLSRCRAAPVIAV